jgi:hypothetical protein
MYLTSVASNNMTVQLETSMARHSPMKKLKNRSGCYKGLELR